jgi:hypothetical protein
VAPSFNITFFNCMGVFLVYLAFGMGLHLSYLHGKKLKLVRTMINVGLNSKNIVNSVRIFNDNDHMNRKGNNTRMNNVLCEYSWDK